MLKIKDGVDDEKDVEVWMNEQMRRDEAEQVQLFDWNETREACQPTALSCADISHIRV